MIQIVLIVNIKNQKEVEYVDMDRSVRICNLYFPVNSVFENRPSMGR